MLPLSLEPGVPAPAVPLAAPRSNWRAFALAAVISNTTPTLSDSGIQETGLTASLAEAAGATSGSFGEQLVAVGCGRLAVGARFGRGRMQQGV